MHTLRNWLVQVDDEKVRTVSGILRRLHACVHDTYSKNVKEQEILDENPQGQGFH